MKKVIAIQKSLLPEERPDTEIMHEEKPSLVTRRKFVTFYKRNGAYNFAKMAQEINKKSDSYSLLHYGVKSKEAFQIANYVFLEMTNDTDDIVSFLKNCIKHVNYKLRYSNGK